MRYSFSDIQQLCIACNELIQPLITTHVIYKVGTLIICLFASVNDPIMLFLYIHNPR